MDREVRKFQLKTLEVFKKNTKSFALSGGTALELFYLKHRFSADLDFFSSQYNLKEIEKLISIFKKSLKCNISLEQEFIFPRRAKVRFYIANFKGLNRPLKIDFIEDVIFTKPKINRIKGLPVYSVENIYLQKIYAVSGSISGVDEVGRALFEGRAQARDVFDLYMLSKKIKPLFLVLKEVSPLFQRGIVHWYRSFSRKELKLSLLDLDIYDKKFNANEMIIYIEEQIKKFIKEEFLE